MHVEHTLYRLVNDFLAKRPALDLSDVPLFYNLFNSGSTTCRKDRTWILRVIELGVCSHADYIVLRRRHVVPILLSFYDSELSDLMTRRHAAHIVLRLCRDEHTAAQLCEFAGLVAWLSTVLHHAAFAGADHGVRASSLEPFPLLPIVLHICRCVLAAFLSGALRHGHELSMLTPSLIALLPVFALSPQAGLLPIACRYVSRSHFQSNPRSHFQSNTSTGLRLMQSSQGLCRGGGVPARVARSRGRALGTGRAGGGLHAAASVRWLEGT
jgi:hypothetical protein